MEILESDPQYEEKFKAATALYTVIDPELFVNIMDLGLVYDIQFPKPERVEITMTLSTPHCPLGEAIQAGVIHALAEVFPKYETAVEIVWEPTWSLDMVSVEGRKLLGMPSAKWL